MSKFLFIYLFIFCVSLRISQRRQGAGDRGQHRYWRTNGVSLCQLWSPDSNYSPERESVTAGQWTWKTHKWSQSSTRRSLTLCSAATWDVECTHFDLCLAGGGEVPEPGSPESSLHSSRHGQRVRPGQSDRFCSGKARRAGLCGSQPHWPEPLQHVGGRCGAHQVADEGSAALRFRPIINTSHHGDALIPLSLPPSPSVCVCVCVHAFQRSISSAIFRWPGELWPRLNKIKDHWWLFHHS